MKDRLILTVGLPRSGKSTWARHTGRPIVNPDSIRLALHGNAFLKEAEPMVWVIAKYMVEALFLAGHHIVILDACNVTRKARDQWRTGDWSVEYVVFSTPKELCMDRARRTTPESNLEGILEAIDRMDSQFESLEDDE